VRAGILITGTEVLSGIISDRNGPWLSERLREHGIDTAEIVIVGDRREDMLNALRFMSDHDLVVTSGGLGPTADDKTAEVVADFSGRPLELDEALEGRIWKILERLRSRWRNLDEDAIRDSNRKQALVPDGATVLEPVGTAPGLVVPPGAEGGPIVLVLPGPPRELQPMWEHALGTPLMIELLGRAGTYEQRIMRLFGIPESEIARSLREIEADGIPIEQLEITTCLRRGEIEIATVFEPPAARVYDQFEAAIRERHADTLFSEDGSTVDDQVIGLLAGRTVAVAESCTGGLMSARLTERAGSSEYMLGGAVGYLDVIVFHHPADSIGAFAVVGMGAVFAGIVRAPMTSVLIIFEMTGGYGLVLPLMIANMSAFALARHWRHTPVYEALLAQDGIYLPHGSGPVDPPDNEPLPAIPVDEVH